MSLIAIKHYIASYFPSHMKREIKELYLSTFILNFGIMMIQIFEPIYLYTLGYSLHQIILYFLLVYGIYFFIMPLGAKFAHAFGYERTIVVSTIIFIAYYFIFYSIATMPVLFFIAPILYALQKTFYWPAFNADFARYAVQDEDGKEIGGINTLILLGAIIAPLAAGFILELWGFAALFTFASILFIISNIPLLTTKEIFVPKPFPYSEAYRRLLSKENRRHFFGYLGFGEELIVLVVWPVFMAVVIVNFLNIGVIVAVATFIAMLVTLYIGKTSDISNKHRILKYGTIVYAFVWFARLLAQGSVGIFFIDIFSRLSKSVIMVPILALTYERAKQRRVLQSIVFYEMGLVVGKLSALIILYGILFFVPDSVAFQVSFVVAGLMSLLYMLL